MKFPPLILLLPLLLVAACDSPSPAVARWDRATVQQGGMTFGVHWDPVQGRAEAYRTSRHLRPSLRAVMANAQQAIQQASGCKVREGTLTGDHAIVTAAITCPQAG